jgi:hypothetical protein
MSIIAICGFQGSGKDTLANILIKKYGYTKMSFAGAVKDVCATIFGWDREMLEGITPESRKWRENIDVWWAKRLGIHNFTPRWAMQQIGTDVFRNHFHNDIWIASIEKKISELSGVVITDGRFPNEIEAIRKMGGTIIHLKTDNMPYWYESVLNGFASPPINIHSSEYNWIFTKPDFIIENTGTIEDLEDNIKIVLNSNNSSIPEIKNKIK